MNKYYIKIGTLIKQKRLMKGFSTQELADILNVSIGFLNNLENAKTDAFNIELISSLCKTLDISPLNFLPESDINIKLDNTLEWVNLEELQQPIVERITSSIKSIINTYLDSLKSHNYDIEYISKITDKIIYELNFTDDFKLK